MIGVSGSIEWPDIGLPDNYSFRPRKCNEGYDGLFKANTAVGHTVRFPSPMNVILVVVLLWPLYRLLWPSTRLRLRWPLSRPSWDFFVVKH